MSVTRRTQVGIIGAGPSGLLLSQLLDLQGVDTIVLERRSRDYVLARVRAGILENGTAELLREAQAAQRMDAEGIIHEGVEIAFGGRLARIDFGASAGGSVIVYGQTELTRDLMDARDQRGGQVLYGVRDVRIEEPNSDQPSIACEFEGTQQHIRCDFIAGCDGFRGISRQAMPPGILRTYERVYPFGWLGILAATRPASDELIYVNHESGFALCSMRSATTSRHYIQCGVDEKVESWSDDRFWTELKRRLPQEVAENLQVGPAIEKSIALARSFVAEPMRYGRLFLAGDAAHIVPPTGAKGLNQAATDVGLLARALAKFFATGSSKLIDSYSDDCLRRVWQSQRFSAWFTGLLHRLPGRTEFDYRLQLAELERLAHSPAAQRAFTSSYVGIQ